MQVSISKLHDMGGRVRFVRHQVKFGDFARINKIVTKRCCKNNKICLEDFCKQYFVVYDYPPYGAVACLGVRYVEELGGYELFNGVVGKTFERQGIMTLLVKSVLNLVNTDLYVNVRHTEGKESADVHNILVNNGFYLLKENAVSSHSVCNPCGNNYDGCNCRFDLYKRDKNLNEETVVVTSNKVSVIVDDTVVCSVLLDYDDCDGLVSRGYNKVTCVECEDIDNPKNREYCRKLLKRVYNSFSCSLYFNHANGLIYPILLDWFFHEESGSTSMNRCNIGGLIKELK